MAASARPPPADGTPASPGCRPGASKLPRRGPGSREGGGPATPRRDSPSRGGAPASRRPRRGGGGAVRRPHLNAARPRTPAKRRPSAEGPRPSLRQSPCRSPRRGSSGLALPSAMATPWSRSPHSLFTAPDRLLKSGPTAVRPLAESAMASRVPTAPRGLTGWRGASFPRLLLIGSCSHSSRENRSPSTLLQPPTPNPPGRTANGGAERGREVGGWAVWSGKAQPMGARRTSPLSSAAPGRPLPGGSRPGPRPTTLAREPSPRKRCGTSGRRESPPRSHRGVLEYCQRAPWRSPDGAGYPRS